MVEQDGVSYADYMHNTVYGSPFEQSTPLVDKTREKCALGLWGVDLVSLARAGCHRSVESS